jgi:hypothetical protein
VTFLLIPKKKGITRKKIAQKESKGRKKLLQQEGPVIKYEYKNNSD